MIYCKFWEIDTDHDLIVNLDDVMRHADGTVNPRALQRLLEGTVSYGAVFSFDCLYDGSRKSVRELDSG